MLMNVKLLQLKSKKFYNLNILFKFAACGILSALVLPPFFILPFGFIVFPILFFLLIDNNYIEQNRFFHFIAGLVYGIGLNIVFFVWIKEPFFIHESTHSLSILSYSVVLYCSIYYGLSFFILGFFQNRFSKLILIPVLFVFNEILRENIGYGFPWLTFSLAFSGNTYILSLIYYLGTYGLSYFVIFIFLLPIAIYNLFSTDNHKFLSKIYFIFSTILILTAIIIIFIRFNQQNSLEKKILKVTLAQLNFSQIDKINNVGIEDKLIQIRNIINKNESDILIFGENDYPYVIKNLDDLNYISHQLANDKLIIIGGTKIENKEFYNTFFLIEKNKVLDFDKKILVPFGEFMPFRNIIKSLDDFVGGSDYSSGLNNRIITTLNNLQIMPIICYEIIFLNDLININNFNTELMINITNDSWFGNFSGPYQHFYLSRMRAVEFNKPLIRVSSNGISASIDNYGNILDYVPLNTQAIKHTKLSILKELPNLKKFHHYYYYLFFILFVLSILINFIKIKQNDSKI